MEDGHSTPTLVLHEMYQQLLNGQWMYLNDFGCPNVLLWANSFSPILWFMAKYEKLMSFLTASACTVFSANYQMLAL